MLAITKITAFDEMIVLSTPSTRWIIQFKGPQEIRRKLEFIADRENLVDQILHTDDIMSVQVLFNDRIRLYRNTLSLAFGVTPFVHQFLNCLQIGVTPCYVRFANT